MVAGTSLNVTGPVRSVPKIVTSSPDATGPGAKLAAFTTLSRREDRRRNPTAGPAHGGVTAHPSEDNYERFKLSLILLLIR